MNKDSNIKEWYIKTYITDELGKEIKDNITFQDLYNVLNMKKDFYETIGVGDSLVRERIFKKLAQIMGVSYETIYNLWV